MLNFLNCYEIFKSLVNRLGGGYEFKETPYRLISVILS